MRRLLFPGIPLLLLSFFVAFQDRVPITAGCRLQQSFQAEIGTKSSSGDRDGADTESLLAVPAEKATMFLTARTFPVGPSPISVAVGDFNGDGKVDLVTANFGDNTVSVLLAKDNFDFQPAVNYAVGLRPRSVALGDFNGDGKLDLAVANYDDNTVSVLLGNGDGTFQPAVNSAVGTAPGSVAVGDFNGDGKLDLVTANPGSNNVSVLLGNADGTFQAAVNYSVGSAPTSIIDRDLNGDGKLDLVTANYNSNNVSVLLGNGDGTFQAAVNYAVGSGPGSVAVGDFNGDGKLDLVTPNFFTSNVSVLLGNGDGTFHTAVNYAALRATSVVVGDFNGDGKLDLVTNGGGLSVQLGNGDGTFHAAVNYGVGALSVEGALSVAVGDFNSDGKLDLVTVNFGGGVSVVRGNGDGTFLAPRSFNTGGCSGFPGAVGDFNGDGKLDLVTPNGGCDNVSLLLGRGNGRFQSAVNYIVGPYGTLPYSVAVGDFNGDGKLDFVTGNYSVRKKRGSVSVLLGNGDGTFQPAVNYAAGSFVTVAAGDFNGDGKLDLVTAGGGNVSVLLGNGDGTFQPAVNSAAPNARSVAIGDFNRDGKLDLVTTNLESNNVSVLIGNGDGTFRTAVNYAVGVFPYSVAVGDFNGDGKLDLAGANSTCKSVCLHPGSVSILLGNGDGTFQAAVNYKVAPTPSYVAVRDFNNDGKLDLVTANGIGNMTVLLGNGDGTFQVGVNYTVGGQIPVSGAVGDFNGDGAPDLAFLNGGVVVLLNTRGTVASLTSSVNPSSVGEEVTFTADVHRTVRGSQIVAGKMTGTVTFRDGTKTLGTVPWLSHINTFSTSSLSKGTHTITATYSGDSNFNPVTSPPLTQTVQ